MLINQVNLVNFRNHKDSKINIKKGINIVVGNNGKGKTNFLDSLFLCSVLSSSKNSKNNEMIGPDEKFAKVQINYTNNDVENIFELVLLEDQKNIFINENKQNKMSEVIGIINTVLFTPDDMFLFKDNPKARRKFFDYEISKIDKEYFLALQQAKKLVNQRNVFLKSIKSLDDENTKFLMSLDQMLATVQTTIIIKREKFIRELNELILSNYQKIAQSSDILELEYKPSFSVKTLEFEQLMMQIRYQNSKNYEKDVQTGQTNQGIHRDDLLCKLNGNDITTYGSQGENRSAILAIKLALTTYITKNGKNNPILLLDDVLSELDQKRQNFLILELLGLNGQIVITTTSTSEIDKRLLDIANIIEF